MKIEFEIPDIKREEVLEVMARQLLGVHHPWSDEEGEDLPYPRGSQAMRLELRKHLDTKIAKVAEELVREHFDETVRQRIAQTVDDVLAAGWDLTDGYGNRTGKRVDLKGRISDLLTATTSDSYNGPKLTFVERLLKSKLEEVFTREFRAEIDAARAKLREQLAVMISLKFAETLKAALGLR